MRRICRKAPRKRSTKKTGKYGSIESCALRLRNHMTKAEKFLWKVLQVRQRGWSVKFQPQQVVFGYIPDFYCEPMMLAIEVDGRIHDRRDVKRNDSLRTRRLNRMGVTVIRFKNSDVFSASHRIVSMIEDAIRSVTTVDS